MRLITDENGTVMKRYNYTAFGSVLSDSGSFDNEYRYTSQAIDEENDLYYMHARYYDKSIGRFLSTDPFPGYLGIPSTMHPYNYCGNNPVNFVDPLGMTGWAEYVWNPQELRMELVVHGCNDDYYSSNFPMALLIEMINKQGDISADPNRDRLFIKLNARDFETENTKEIEFQAKLPKGKTKPPIIQYINEAMSRKQWSISFTREALEQSSFPYAKGKVIDVFTGKVTRTVKDLGTAFGLGMDFSFGPQPLPGENYYEVYTSFTGRFGGISFGFGQSDFFPFIDPPYGTFKTINVHLGIGLGLPFGGVYTYTE